MKLTYAYYCPKCKEVFDIRARLHFRVLLGCPSCLYSYVVPLTKFMDRYMSEEAKLKEEKWNVGKMKGFDIGVYNNIYHATAMECPFCRRMATHWCVIDIESTDEGKVIIKSEPLYLCASCWSLLKKKLKEIFCADKIRYEKS